MAKQSERSIQNVYYVSMIMSENKWSAWFQPASSRSVNQLSGST